MRIDYNSAQIVQSQVQRRSQHQQYLLMQQSRPLHRGCAFRRISSTGEVLPWGDNNLRYLRTNAKGPTAAHAYSIAASASLLVVGNADGVHAFDRESGERLWNRLEDTQTARTAVAIDEAGTIMASHRTTNQSWLYEFDDAGNTLQQTAVGTGPGNTSLVDRISPTIGGYVHLLMRSSGGAFAGNVTDLWLDPDRDAINVTDGSSKVIRNSNAHGQYAAFSHLSSVDSEMFRLWIAILDVEVLDPGDIFGAPRVIRFTVGSGHGVTIGSTLRWHDETTVRTPDVTDVTATTITIEAPTTWTGQVLSTTAVSFTNSAACGAVGQNADLFYYRRNNSTGESFVGKALAPNAIAWETSIGLGFAGQAGTVPYARVCPTASGSVYALVQQLNFSPPHEYHQPDRLLYFDASGSLQWDRAMSMSSESYGNIGIDPRDGTSLMLCGNVWPSDQHQLTGLDY